MSNEMKIARWLLRVFRLVIITGALAWSVGTDELSMQARAFVDDALGSLEPVDRPLGRNSKRL